MRPPFPEWLSEVDYPVIIFTDKTGKILKANKGFADLIGMETRDISGMNVMEFISHSPDGEFGLISEGEKILLLKDKHDIVYRCCGFCFKWDEKFIFILEREKMTYNELLKEIAETNLILASTSRELIRKNQKLKEALQRLRTLEESDYLTQILNRKGFIRRLNSELKRATRYKYPLCFILADLDNFKKINDTHGHSFGDEVLRRFAKFVRKQIRESDLFGRLGGEEFALALPHTDCFQGKLLCERLISDFEKYSLKNFGEEISFSCGITSFRDRDSFQDLYRRADRALYLAKAKGKKQAIIYEGTSLHTAVEQKQYTLIDL